MKSAIESLEEFGCPPDVAKAFAQAMDQCKKGSEQQGVTWPTGLEPEVWEQVKAWLKEEGFSVDWPGDLITIRYIGTN